MTEKEKIKIANEISDYILLEQFDKHEVGIVDALTILVYLCERIMYAICQVHRLEQKEMVNHFCKALKISNDDTNINLN